MLETPVCRMAHSKGRVLCSSKYYKYLHFPALAKDELQNDSYFLEMLHAMQSKNKNLLYFCGLGPIICLLPPIAIPLPAELPLFMLSPPV